MTFRQPISRMELRLAPDCFEWTSALPRTNRRVTERGSANIGTRHLPPHRFWDGPVSPDSAKN